MKKLIMFLAGLLLLVMTFIAVFLGGAIYDVANDRVVDVYFFEPNPLSADRPGQPISIDDDSMQERMKELLIQRFVTEYFSVLPDVANIEQRTMLGKSLPVMAMPNVVAQWQQDIAPELTQMASRGMLRFVYVVDIKPYGDYHDVTYITKTWMQPNNMNETPVQEEKNVLLQIHYAPGLTQSVTEEENNIRDNLAAGYDPAGAFTFKILKVVTITRN